jgi:hypothetical protein
MRSGERAAAAAAALLAAHVALHPPSTRDPAKLGQRMPATERLLIVESLGERSS